MNDPITAEQLAAAPLGSTVLDEDARPLACKLDGDSSPWITAAHTPGGLYAGDGVLARWLAEYYPSAVLARLDAVPVSPERASAAPGAHRAEALARAVEWATPVLADWQAVVDAATAFEAFLSGTTDGEARA